jgi:hypothetical protein
MIMPRFLPRDQLRQYPTGGAPAAPAGNFSPTTGVCVSRPFVARERADEDLGHKKPRFAAATHGFDGHGGVRLAAGERIEERKDGRVAYLLKTPRRGSTHRVMTPVELPCRRALLVAGAVDAKVSGWRRAVQEDEGSRPRG